MQLEARLHAIELPANGSIYYNNDLPSGSPRIPIPGSDLCIGPNVALKWWFVERASLRINRGPCKCLSCQLAFTSDHTLDEDPIDGLRNPALKELTWLRAYGRPRFPFERVYHESMNYRISDPAGHIASLESYLKITPELLPSNEPLQPVLRHPDLQSNNILLSDDLDIVGLINWQHASVLPLFLASGIPKFFQNYDGPESVPFRPPPNPDLTDMDKEERTDALQGFAASSYPLFLLGLHGTFQ